MRKRYHIKIDKKEEPSFTRIAKHLGITPKVGIYLHEDGDWQPEQDYVIQMSKYELLALRLMFKTGLIKEIEETNKVESLHSSL